jgi:hypothetical protein
MATRIVGVTFKVKVPVKMDMFKTVGVTFKVKVPVKMDTFKTGADMNL